MKLREYSNSVGSAVGAQESKRTMGYPCKLPLFPTQFAIVRPPDDLFDFRPRGWQVIHIKTGKRIGKAVCDNKAEAVRFALAELEYQFDRLGKKKVMELIGKTA